MKFDKMQFKFVRTVPMNIKEGILYISIHFSTVIHRCACGCGEKIVTPIKPTDWQLTYDGDSVSIYPSIGNWNIPCQSHYWIFENRVIWYRRWSKHEIKQGRIEDKELKEIYYKEKSTPTKRWTQQNTKKSKK